jgi:hypothetical protein
LLNDFVILWELSIHMNCKVMVMRTLKVVNSIYDSNLLRVLQFIPRIGVSLSGLFSMYNCSGSGGFYCVSGRTAASIVYVTVNGSELRL